LIRLRGVGRSYAGGVVALDDVDLDLDRGSYTAVVGPSGSGKSTLLNVLGLLEAPSLGTYHLEGVDVGAMAERPRAETRGRRIGFVFQAFNLLPARTVADNIRLGLVYAGVPRAERATLVDEALELVGLTHRAHFSPRTLSGGEAQRAAIARAVAKRPAVLLCDEPTGNLDRRTTATVLATFDDLHRQGLTVVVVTHDPAVSARADRVLEVVDGRLRPAPA
jgi:putative ABC transport system ATP-binding protein